MSIEIKDMPFSYGDSLQALKQSSQITHKCSRCGKCCIVPATVLTAYDLQRLSQYFGINNAVLFQRDMKITKSKSTFFPIITYKTNMNDTCLYYNNGCTVYEARPLICRTYPIIPLLGTSEYYLNTDCPSIGTGNKKSLKKFLNTINPKEIRAFQYLLQIATIVIDFEQKSKDYTFAEDMLEILYGNFVIATYLNYGDLKHFDEDSKMNIQCIREDIAAVEKTGILPMRNWKYG